MEVQNDFADLHPGPCPRGAHCSKLGAFVDNVPLLTKEGDHRGRPVWAPRRIAALNLDLGSGYCIPIDAAELVVRLNDVVDALNKEDLGAARAALRTLRLPPFPKRSGGRLDGRAQGRLADELRKVSLLQREDGASVAKYGFNAAEARVPAGNHTLSGEWASDGSAASGEPDVELAAYRNVKVAKYRTVYSLPPDAVPVALPDGRPIDDPASPTGKLLAPPRADFRQVYAAGKSISALSFEAQYAPAKAAIGQEGTFDFQRDVARHIEYHSYVHVSNYAAGVYMAGAGHSLLMTLLLGEGYALTHSSNYGDESQIEWIIRGWRDASSGRWSGK